MEIKPPMETGHNHSARKIAIWNWLFVLSIGFVVVLFGGYGVGIAIVNFGSIGSIFLWPIGFIAGMVVAKWGNCQTIHAILLAVCLLLALVMAETCWIHWKIKGGEEWIEAIKLLPKAASQYRTDFLIASISAVFAAISAYRTSLSGSN